MGDVINRPVFLKEVWMDFQDANSLLLNFLLTSIKYQALD